MQLGHTSVETVGARMLPVGRNERQVSAAQRRYRALCDKAFAIVIPPGEPETERDSFVVACARRRRLRGSSRAATHVREQAP